MSISCFQSLLPLAIVDLIWAPTTSFGMISLRNPAPSKIVAKKLSEICAAFSASLVDLKIGQSSNAGSIFFLNNNLTGGAVFVPVDVWRLPLIDLTLTLFCITIPFSISIGKCSTTSAEKIWNPAGVDCVITSPGSNTGIFLYHIWSSKKAFEILISVSRNPVSGSMNENSDCFSITPFLLYVPFNTCLVFKSSKL